MSRSLYGTTDTKQIVNRENRNNEIDSENFTDQLQMSLPKSGVRSDGISA